jgi:hypothetical protein
MLVVLSVPIDRAPRATAARKAPVYDTARGRTPESGRSPPPTVDPVPVTRQRARESRPDTARNVARA